MRRRGTRAELHRTDQQLNTQNNSIYRNTERTLGLHRTEVDAEQSTGVAHWDQQSKVEQSRAQTWTLEGTADYSRAGRSRRRAEQRSSAAERRSSRVKQTQSRAQEQGSLLLRQSVAAGRCGMVIIVSSRPADH